MTRLPTRQLAWGAFTGPAAYAVGTTWWVDGSSPVCSDTGLGDQTTPFCTISKGVAKATTPGDTASDAPFDVRGLTLDADPGPLHRE